MSRKPYPTDVSDEEWSFAAPYLVLMTQDAPQREHWASPGFPDTLDDMMCLGGGHAKDKKNVYK